mmetsp:Transcript_7518/g.21964  ORF Transcript_7518/g.21964 Transcript_7518/m.21964 type:complete len:321 (-) Transcript_7518:327-1289(-)
MCTGMESTVCNDSSMSNDELATDDPGCCCCCCNRRSLRNVATAGTPDTMTFAPSSGVDLICRLRSITESSVWLDAEVNTESPSSSVDLVVAVEVAPTIKPTPAMPGVPPPVRAWCLPLDPRNELELCDRFGTFRWKDPVRSGAARVNMPLDVRLTVRGTSWDAAENAGRPMRLLCVRRGAERRLGPPPERRLPDMPPLLYRSTPRRAGSCRPPPEVLAAEAWASLLMARSFDTGCGCCSVCMGVTVSSICCSTAGSAMLFFCCFALRLRCAWLRYVLFGLCGVRIDAVEMAKERSFGVWLAVSATMTIMTTTTMVLLLRL